MSEHITEDTDAALIEVHCNTCDDGLAVPNKGIGRAMVAAWRTRHQHLPASSEREERPMNGRVGVEQTPDIEAAWERIKRASWEGGNPAAIGELAAAVREARAAELREFAERICDRNAEFGFTTEARHFGRTYGKLARDRADRIAVDAPEGGEGR